MCFAVPYKVIKINDDIVVVEGGKVVRIDKEMKVKKGDYLQVVGNVAVGSLNKKEGLNIRKLIKSLNA